MTRTPRRAVPGPALLLVGDTDFTRGADGRWHTHGALSKQLDQWFAEFDRVVIAAHVQEGAAPPDHRALTHQHLTFVPLRRAGGSGLVSKLGVAAAAAGWVITLARMMRRADAVHLRAPCNVTLIAIPLARVLCPRRYAIYAGNWEPLGVEPFSYRVQRWMLHHFGGVVHVYAPADHGLAPHLRPNVSPSFTTAELAALAPAAARRTERLERDPLAQRAVRLACVGSFSQRKNQEAVLRAAAILRDRGVRTEVRFAGVGRSRKRAEDLARDLRLEDDVAFLGQIGRSDVEALFEWADINLLVSLAEGFGKVLLEGMSVGCPAICGTGAMQRSIIGEGSRGRAADPPTPQNIADAVVSLRLLPVEQQREMVEQCRTFVNRFTAEAFGDEVRTIMRDVWAIAPPPPIGPERQEAKDST